MRKTVSITCVVGVWLLLGAASCSRPMPNGAVENPGPEQGESSPNAAQKPKAQPERAVQPLLLAGPITDPDAEISGAAWCGDRLLLLPQYPERFGEGQGNLFAIARDVVEAAVKDGDKAKPIEPQLIRLEAPGVAESIDGFQGYEAIVCRGDRAWLTIEAETSQGMDGYAVTGTWNKNTLTIQPSPKLKFEAQTDVGNMAYEAILLHNEELVTFYEVNGAAPNPKATALVLDLALSSLKPVAMAPVEYRITDVTELDEQGKFWAINYHWPGSKKVLPKVDPIADAFGRGTTHAKSPVVERLVEFRYTGTKIERTDTAPLQLELLGGEKARNWEGIVRLGTQGFVIVTDKYPDTQLGFVAF